MTLIGQGGIAMSATQTDQEGSRDRRAPAHRRQRLSEHGDPVQRPAVSRQPEGGGDRRQPDPAHRQGLRLRAVPGAAEEVLGRRATSLSCTASAISIRRARTSGRWTSGTPARRTRSAPKAGWAAWCANIDPNKENVVTTRQLRPVPVPRAVGAWRSGRVRRRPAGEVRLPAEHPGARAAPAGAGALRTDVQAGAGQRRHGIPRHHRP